ncbi:MAG: IPT/TIG domain-containing protein, partial [Myxococcales bacterium]|nr:IPT/TIG domain-containing protein [Myxococcales bacterium]
LAVDAEANERLWPPDEPGSFTVRPPPGSPRLLFIAPERGPATGGTRVALRGQGFTADVAVRFAGQPATAIEVASGELALAVTPPGPAGAVDVEVQTPDGVATLPGGFRYVPPPEILQIVPPEGPTTEETLLVIDGRGFEAGATVTLGDVAGLRTDVLSPERLATTAPPHPAGTVDVTVTNPDGQAGTRPEGFTWWPPPVIEAIEPERGPDLGGTPFRLRGRDFRAPATIWLGEWEALDVRVDADGRGARAVSAAAPAGTVDVRLYNPDGQLGTLEQAWRYVGPPILEGAEPPIVSRCGGGVVTLVGQSFEPDMQVRLDGVLAEVISVSPDGTRARVRVPPGREGPVEVVVTNPDGRSGRRPDILAYGIQPEVRTVAPTQVPIWGGVVVRVTGADLDRGVQVAFDDVPAERVVVVMAGCEAVLDVVVPPHPPGLAAVSAVNLDGVGGALPDGVEYVAPTLDPPHGLVPGYANVTLRGVDLRPGLTLRLGGVAPRALERVSDEEWRVLTPAGDRGPVAVEVRNVDGRGAVLDGAFSYRVYVDETDGNLTPDGDCNDVTVADMDDDGHVDLVTAAGSIGGIGRLAQPPAIHYGDGGGGFTRVALAPAGNGMNTTVGDLDADGDLDLFVANLSSEQSVYFRNDGGRRMTAPARFPARANAYDASFLDVEGDGDLDLLLLRNGSPENNERDGPERLYLNDGAGGLSEASARVEFNPVDVHDHDMAIGDLNGDGLPDAVIVVDNISAAFGSSRNRLLLNDGRGRLVGAPSPFNDLPGDWLNVALADVDADGDLDVLLPQDYVEGLSRPGTPAIALYLNDGRAGFRAAHERIRGLPPLPAFEVVPADLDGDGDLDLVVAIYGLLFADGRIEASRSAILLNDGTATFFESSQAFERGLDIATSDFGPGDFDGDGDLDLFECAAEGESRLWMQRD